MGETCAHCGREIDDGEPGWSFIENGTLIQKFEHEGCAESRCFKTLMGMPLQEFDLLFAKVKSYPEVENLSICFLRIPNTVAKLQKSDSNFSETSVSATANQASAGLHKLPVSSAGAA